MKQVNPWRDGQDAAWGACLVLAVGFLCWGGVAFIALHFILKWW
jgi:hypothetical protein